MDYFAGLDISMDETHVCVLDREGVVVRESKTELTAEAIAGSARRHLQSRLGDRIHVRLRGGERLPAAQPAARPVPSVPPLSPRRNGRHDAHMRSIPRHSSQRRRPRPPIDLGQQSAQIINHTRTLNPHPAVGNQRRQHPLEARLDLSQRLRLHLGLIQQPAPERVNPAIEARPRTQNLNHHPPAATRMITSL